VFRRLRNTFQLAVCAANRYSKAPSGRP